jgi:hypothetical protein
MVRLTTSENAIVLDPFAGAGTVPTVAAALGRYGVGIELNRSYVRAFEGTGYKRLRMSLRSTVPIGKQLGSTLRRTIIDLRILKFARTLFAGLARSDRLNGSARSSIGAFMLADVKRPAISESLLDTRALAKISVLLILKKGADSRRISRMVDDLVQVKPLSKFGLLASVKVMPHSHWNSPRFAKTLPKGNWYVYRRGQFFKHDAHVLWSGLGEALTFEAIEGRQKVPSLFAQIGLSLEVPVPDRS